MDEGKKRRGEFFAIERVVFDELCDLGEVGLAEVYLLIACGTDGSNRVSTWSAKAAETHLNIDRRTATRRIDRLIEGRFLRKFGSRARPRYELISAKERWELGPRQSACLDKIRAGAKLGAEDRRLAPGLIKRGFVQREEERGDLSPVLQKLIEPIWLPNALVTGAANELSPIVRLSKMQDVDILRLLAHLYLLHDLRAFGGIDPELLWREFKAEKVEWYNGQLIWKFESVGSFHRLSDALCRLSPAYRRPPPPGSGERDIIWHLLERISWTGLWDWILEVRDAPHDRARVIYRVPLDRDGASVATSNEVALADALKDRLSYVLSGCRSEGAMALCDRLAASDELPNALPIDSNVVSPSFRGVARLRYRPRTEYNAAGLAALDRHAFGEKNEIYR